MTADKDALQLVDPRVTVLSVLGRTGERVLYDAAKVQEKWGVPPERIPDILALMGDSIDNIPGVPGVGEVTARSSCGSSGASRRSTRTSRSSRARSSARRSRRTATRRSLSRQLAVLEGTLPIEFDLERFRIREPEWERLRALWTELEFTTLLKQVPARAVTLPAETVAVVDRTGWREFLQRAGDRIAIEPVVTGAAPDLALHGVAAYAPGRARLSIGWPELPAGVTSSGTTRRR